MPKNTVTDPITDQEMAFAHLIMSGTMNDRQSAEAAGLNPDTAAYTKSKPRVRDYMIEYRNAVTEKLIDQEVEGLRKLNLGRDQVLARLWELAKLSHEVTRGSIAGQIKALSMIIAIEGLIPGGRVSSAATQLTAPPVDPQIYVEAWRRKQLQAEEPGETAASTQAQPAANQVSEPPPQAQHHSALNPFVIPEGRMRFPDAPRNYFDVALDTTNSLSLPPSLRKGPNGNRR